MGNTCFTSGSLEPHNYSWLHRQNAYMLLRFCTLNLQWGFLGRNSARCHVGLLSTFTQGSELCATLSLPSPLSLTPGNVWERALQKVGLSVRKSDCCLSRCVFIPVSTINLSLMSRPDRSWRDKSKGPSKNFGRYSLCCLPVRMWTPQRRYLNMSCSHNINLKHI